MSLFYMNMISDHRNIYLEKNRMAKNGRVAILNMRSEEDKDIINGVSVCSLVFL